MGGDKKSVQAKTQTLYNKRLPSGNHERFISGSYILSYDDLRKKNLAELKYQPVTGNQFGLHGESLIDDHRPSQRNMCRVLENLKGPDPRARKLRATDSMRDFQVRNNPS
jgi:hypothetical protein